MRTTTTIVAAAVGALALAMPMTARAIPEPALQVPLAGHLTVASQMQAEHVALAQRRLTRKATRLAAKLARAHGHGFSRQAYRRARRNEAPARLAARIRHLRRDLRRARRAAKASPALEAIAACESGGNPRTNTGNGFYGKYQFSQSTWESVGGSGSPAAASEAEQNRRAASLYARAGASPWPVCGR